MQGKGRAQESIWSVAFVSIVVVNFFQSMGMQMMSTVIPLYAYDLGAAPTIVGLIAGAFGVTALLARPFFGPAFDAFSKKWMLFASICVITFATFLYGFVESVPLLVAVRLLHGLGMGGAAPLGLALAVECLPPSRLASGVSFYTLSQAAAKAVGPAFGIWLEQTWSFHVAFNVAGVSMLVAVALVYFLKEPEGEPRRPYELRLDRIFAPQAIVPAMLLFLLCTAFCCTNSFLAIYASVLGVDGIGWYFTIYAVCLFVTQPMFGRLADAIGTTKVLLPGMLCFAASFVIISASQSLPMFLVAAVVASCGYGCCAPLIQALMMKRVPPESHGAGSNTTYTGIDAANLAGPIVGGAVVEALHETTGSEAVAYSGMWLVLLAPIACAFVLYLVWSRRAKARDAAGKGEGA